VLAAGGVSSRELGGSRISSVARCERKVWGRLAFGLGNPIGILLVAEKETLLTRRIVSEGDERRRVGRDFFIPKGVMKNAKSLDKREGRGSPHVGVTTRFSAWL